MHPQLNPIRDAGFKSCLAALLLVSSQSLALAQAQPATDSTAAPAAKNTEEEQTYQLSPFTVTTDKDKGYKATNTTSGTRLNTAIKDLPMPIEVITEQFIRDTGSKDLRESLRYSAGIQLQSQNDWGTTQGWAATTPGRINNPEGSTGTADQTRVKIRGFLTEASLRDGFRRQNSTDSVNLSRVEVIRGPSSLLYGVGNFGGVVNYLVKQPSNKAGGEISFGVGSYNQMRGTLDYTGPVSDTVAYRLTAAYQSKDDYTDFNQENHYFVAPIVTWQPFKDTKVTFDAEFGEQDRSGIGFKGLRATRSGFVNDSAAYNAGFTVPGNNDPRTFRWSGPDTFNNSKAYNVLLKLEQKLAENLYFNLGYNNSSFSYDQLDVSASFQNPGTSTPAWARGTVTYVPIQNGQSGFPTGPQTATIGYQWNLSDEHDNHEQIRADLTYKLDLFQDSKWLKLGNTFLLGLNYTNERYESSIRGTPYDRNMFKNPQDASPFKYGFQADNTPDHVMTDLFHQVNKVKDAALYAVYQGKLLDEWVTLIAGARKDRSWNKFWHYNPQWGADHASHNQGYDALPVEQYGEPSKDTTYQYGIDVRLTRNGSLSLYAMKAESSLPNYDGAKDFNGNVIKAALGEDKEIGLKFDLLEGRVSGTISKFEITRTRVGIGNPGGIWWAPTDTGTSNFNPSKNIVYQINDLNPVNNGWNGAVVASTAQWNAAVAAGTVYQATNSAGNTNWYVNASSATGAAFMDSIFSNVLALKQTGWWGWIYNTDNLTNSAFLDYNGGSPPGPTGGRSVPLGSDESTGWDAQILLSPTDNLQIALSWAHVEKKVLKASGWIKYPYPQDRWAIWYAPIDWADGGTPASARFGDVNDTSTHKSFGDGLTLDGTPKNQGSAWVNYNFAKDSSFKGLSIGGGVVYEGPGVIYPTFFSQPKDAQGNVIFLSTKSKKMFNAMARYEFKVRGRDASVQLNIDNVTNNTDYYGYIDQAPRRWSLTYTQKL